MVITLLRINDTNFFACNGLPDALVFTLNTNPKPRTRNRYVSKRFTYNSLRPDQDHLTAWDLVHGFERRLPC